MNSLRSPFFYILDDISREFNLDFVRHVLKLFFIFSPLPNSVCELLSEGVAGIFGPGTSETSGIVTAIANAADIPHMTAFWEREPLGGKRMVNHMTLNVYPDTEVLSRAFAELLIDYTWKSYTIIYEDDDGLMRLKDVLQIHDPQSSPITVRCEAVLFIA